MDIAIHRLTKSRTQNTKYHQILKELEWASQNAKKQSTKPKAERLSHSKSCVQAFYHWHQSYDTITNFKDWLFWTNVNTILGVNGQPPNLTKK